MQGHTHEIGALLLAVPLASHIITPSAPVTIIGIYALGALTGGLLPDADMANSTIGRKMFILLWPAYLLRAILRVVCKFIKPLQKAVRFLGHRGIFHTPFIWICLYGLANICCDFLQINILKVFLYGCMIGTVSHLILDLISGGIPLLFPLCTKRIHIPGIRIKTGGRMENLICFCMGTMLLLCIYKGIV